MHLNMKKKSKNKADMGIKERLAPNSKSQAAHTQTCHGFNAGLTAPFHNSYPPSSVFFPVKLRIQPSQQ